MRKKNREVTDFTEITDIIARCDTIRIAMFDGDYPYIVPMNFGEEIHGSKVVFYLHAAYGGKRNELLAQNPHVAFEMDCSHGLYYKDNTMTCSFTYESVMGTGTVEFLPDAEKDKALTAIMNHYHPEGMAYNHKVNAMTLCLKLTVETLTAKHSLSRRTDPEYREMPLK